MLPALRATLAAHAAERPYTPDQPVFPSRSGRANRPDNIRSTLIAPALQRANELLIDGGRAPIRHMTPHTLRRTFASLLAEIGVHPRRAMYLLGTRASRADDRRLPAGARRLRRRPRRAGAAAARRTGLCPAIVRQPIKTPPARPRGHPGGHE